MLGFLSLVAMGMLFLMAVILFLNELYYRKRISVCGTIIFLATTYQLFYIDHQNNQLLELTKTVVETAPKTPPKGE